MITSVTDGRNITTYKNPSQYPGITLVLDTDFPYGPRVTSWNPTNGLISSDGINGELSTNYVYDANGRLASTTTAGVKTEYTYNSRGNITQTRIISATPGTPADIVTSAGYPATCSDFRLCNKPQYTIDARGKQTDYLYDPLSSNVASVTFPADDHGVRPQIRYVYTALAARYLNGAGVLISGPVFYRLQSSSQCSVGNSCIGTASEVKTTFTYGPDTAGQPASITVSSGDGLVSSVTSFTYTPLGDVKTIDGPLTGVADTTRYYYDLDRRLTGQIGPDPDGSGPMLRRASKTSYNAGGQVTMTEVGTATNQSDTGLSTFVSAERTETTYDAQAYPIRQTLFTGGVTQVIRQYSYNNSGLIDCEATRMNAATFASLPASACTAAASGSEGADRIVKQVYSSPNRVASATVGYGTPEASTESITYSSYGTPATVTDANGNKTSFGYDGFGRRTTMQYPSTAIGSGSSSSSDWEGLTYDPAGNVVAKRLRNGQSIGYVYDALGRLTQKDLPSPESDVTTDYDLIGRTISIANTAQTLTFGYDALGRLMTQGTPMGTITSAYDAAGQRTRLTWPDGFFVDYDRLVTGELSAIRENGGTTGSSILAAYQYDSQGRRAGMVRGNGTTTSYGYDAASRLTSLTQDLAGSAFDLVRGFTYNVVGQIKGMTQSNDLYAFPKTNVTRPYTNNGLNQATQSGQVALQYDAMGNIASSGSTTYTYTAENRLSIAAGTSLYYDPLGRLFQIESTTWFGYDGQDMIGEWTPGGAIRRRYVHGDGNDEPIIWYSGSSTNDRRWLHADERGSISAVSNATGSVEAINAYDEYGIPASANVGRFQYTGQAFIDEIGLYYYKARFYSPTLGRFMQTDPIGYTAGLNVYAYVGGDPINLSDPSGLDPATVAPPPPPPEPDIVVTGARLPPISFGFYQTVFATPPVPNGVAGGRVSKASGYGRKVPVNSVKQTKKKRQKDKNLPKCAQNFLKGRISSDPSRIRFHDGGGGLPNSLDNSVTYGNDIYLASGMMDRSDRGALIHKFHEIQHTSQNARMKLSAFDHFGAYLMFGGHDSSPLEQGADKFGQDTYDAYKAAGLDKTCPF